MGGALCCDSTWALVQAMELCVERVSLYKGVTLDIRVSGSLLSTMARPGEMQEGGLLIRHYGQIYKDQAAENLGYEQNLGRGSERK